MATQRFYSAVDKLMNAFIMGALKHDYSCSCAAGSLCNGNQNWADYHLSMLYCNTSVTNIARATALIHNTGYNPREIYRIEAEFEGRDISLIENGTAAQKDKSSINDYNDKDGFKGLCKVFDYLTSIEDWSEEESKINLVEMCLQN